MKIIDYPMACCGMLEAEGFDRAGPVGTGDDADWRAYTEEDWDFLFRAIEQAQRDKMRNCALITLAEFQGTVIGYAEKHGFKKVFEFYNPNSQRMVGLYTKVLFEVTERNEAGAAKKQHLLDCKASNRRNYSFGDEPKKIRPPLHHKETANAV